MINEEVLEYKEFYLFYENLYIRLFDIINLLIDEHEYDINIIKSKLIDFYDFYSYYIVKKKVILKGEKEENIYDKIKEFPIKYETLNNFPSEEYIQLKNKLNIAEGNIYNMTEEDHKKLINYYYTFYEVCLNLITEFIDISKACGFLPNLKSKKSARTIGYANYKFFFVSLENLKNKLSEITLKINIKNCNKVRRCCYALLLAFRPYFKNKELEIELFNNLSFKFLEQDEIIRLMRKTNNYDSLYSIPKETRIEIDNKILNELKNNVSLLKRFISFEFGELDITPTIKKKYDYDPTGT